MNAKESPPDSSVGWILRLIVVYGSCCPSLFLYISNEKFSPIFVVCQKQLPHHSSQRSPSKREAMNYAYSENAFLPQNSNTTHSLVRRLAGFVRWGKIQDMTRQETLQERRKKNRGQSPFQAISPRLWIQRIQSSSLLQAVDGFFFIHRSSHISKNCNKSFSCSRGI